MRDLLSNSELLERVRVSHGTTPENPEHVSNIAPEEVESPAVLFGAQMWFDEQTHGLSVSRDRMHEKVRSFRVRHPRCSVCGGLLGEHDGVMKKGTRQHRGICPKETEL